MVLTIVNKIKNKLLYYTLIFTMVMFKNTKVFGTFTTIFIVNTKIYNSFFMWDAFINRDTYHINDDFKQSFKLFIYNKSNTKILPIPNHHQSPY